MLVDAGEALLVPTRADQPAPGVVGDAVAGQVLVGAGHAVARDRAEHDRRVDLLEVVEAQAAPGQGAGTHGLHHGVGAPHQVLVHLDAFGRAQVEGDRPLAAADVVVQQRVALDDRPGHAPDVVTGRTLHLDHLGTQIGQVGADGARAQQRAFDDADAGQGLGGFGHGVLLELCRYRVGRAADRST